MMFDILRFLDGETAPPRVASPETQQGTQLPSMRLMCKN